MNKFSEAFQAKGIHQRDVDLDIAIAKYLNSGGTVLGIIDRANVAAARMSGEGQSCVASTGQASYAQTRQQVEGTAGQLFNARKGRDLVAAAPFNRGGDGHTMDALLERPPIASIPVREPTKSQRSAALAAAKVASISVMDTLKIDGRAIGDWTVSEAKRRGHDKTREGYILIAASRLVANAEPNALLRNVVKVRELQRIQQRAMEVADAV